jgi:hypothetical protein
MLYSVKRLHGFAIGAADGSIGRVWDAYFDDRLWGIRYLVVDTTHWLSRRRVLISPLSLRGTDAPQRVLPTSLTRAQIAASPDIDTDKPVSRQHEVELYRYYGFPYYWVSAEVAGRMPYAAAGGVPGGLAALELETDWARTAPGDPHLRSVRAVTSHYVHAADADIGHVADFLYDETAWAIRYVAVATGSWWPGRKVLVPVEWVTWLSWDAHTVDVSLRSETIRLAPQYDAAFPPSAEYLDRLRAYYGVPPASPPGLVGPGEPDGGPAD